MTTTLTDDRTAALAKAQAVVDGAKAAGRTELTSAENEQIKSALAEVDALNAKLKTGEESAELLKRLATIGFDGEESVLTGKLKFSALGTIAGRKAALGAIQAASGNAGGFKALVGSGITTEVPFVFQNVLEMGQLPQSLLELLPVIQHATPSYEWLKQTVRTNNAAIVAPGGTKPTSVFTVVPQTAHLAVVAHLSEVYDRYLLQDRPALVDFVQNEMLYGLAVALENEVLNGDGTGIHMTGILHTSGLQTLAAGADKVTTLRTALTHLTTAGYAGNVIVLNPADWEAIETNRNASGQFDLDPTGGPVDSAKKQVWGTQVVTSPSLAAGTALAMDQSQPAAVLDTDTQGLQTVWTRDGDAALLATNQLQNRTEGRFGVSVMRPDAIVKITLPA